MYKDIKIFTGEKFISKAFGKCFIGINKVHILFIKELAF